jgi:hypothetical protein
VVPRRRPQARARAAPAGQTTNGEHLAGAARGGASGATVGGRRAAA